MSFKRGTIEHSKMRSDMAKKQGFGKINLGIKRPPFSKKWRDKISKAQIGRKKTPEIRRKIKLSHLGKKYKPMSKEGRKNISESRKGKYSGENHPFWKGGKIDYMKNHAPRPKPEQCEICGAFGKDTKIGLCYDHNHETGEFRGWICTRCNVAIGMVKENTETLEAIIKYIKESRNRLKEIRIR